MEEYKISLGAEISQQGLSNVKDQIKTLESNPIKLTLDKNLSNEIKAIKEQIDSLGSSKGKNKNALAINTDSVEKSLNDIAVTIKEVRDALGTIDNKSGMKSLLSSINQITASLGKASDETQTLVSFLSALSKKDFSFNIGIDLNNKKSTLAYGREARQSVLPELKSQINYLNDLFDKELQGITRSKKINIDQSKVGLLGKVNKIKMDYTVAGGSSSSMIGSLEAQEKYINQMVELAKASDINLDGFYSQHSKSASQLVNELTGVSQATEVVEEQTQKLKNIFGGGIDSESLTQILKDLNEINTAIKTLASDTSLGGLTQSFDNLSNTLKEITRDISTFAQAVNSGLVSSRDISSGITNEVKGISNSFKNAGTESANEFESGFKKAFNLDDVISKEVKGLMKAEGISTRGKTGKQAEEEIAGAFKEYLSDGSDKNINKVTDALLNNKRVVDETKRVYQELDAAVRKVNNRDKNGEKVLFDQDIMSLSKDDIKQYQEVLGKRFVTKVNKFDKYQLFSDWVNDIVSESNISLDKDSFDKDGKVDAANAIKDIYDKLLIQRSKDYMSTQELVSSGNFNFGEAESSIRAAANNIVNSQQRIQDASSASADSTVQDEQKKQQAYQETLEAINRIDAETQKHKDNLRKIDEQFKPLYDEDSGFSKEDVDQLKQPVIDDYWSGQEDELAKYNSLLQERIELENKLKTIESSFKTTTGASSTSNIDDTLKDVGIEAKATETHIENLISTLRSLGFSSGNIDNITKDFDNLGITVKNVTSKLQSDGSVTVTVKGIDQYERAVTLMRGFKKNLETDEFDYVNFGSSVSQDFKETENAFKKLKSLAKEIGSIKSDIAQLNTTDSTNEIKKLTSHLEECESEYNDLLAITGRNLSDNQWEELDRTVDDVNKNLDILDGKLADTSALKKRNQAFKELSSIAKEMDSLEVEIFKLESAGGNETKVKLLKEELESLRSTYRQTMESMERPLSSEQLQSLAESAFKSQDKIKKLKAEIEDARAEATKKIEYDIDVGNLDKRLSDVKSSFGKLTYQSDELKTAIDGLETELNAMKLARTNGETEKLIDLNDRLAKSFDKVKNAISISSKSQEEAAAKALVKGIDKATKESASALKEQEDTVEKIHSKMQRSSMGVLDSDYDRQISSIESSFGKLTNKSEELRGRIESLKTSLAQMYKTDDAHKLIALNEQLEQSLKNVSNAVANAARSQEEAAAKEAAAIQKTQKSSAEKINSKLDDGTYKASISNIEKGFDSLLVKSDELRDNINLLKLALDIMVDANVKGDLEYLVNAEDEFNKILKLTTNQLTIAKNANADFSSEQKKAFSELSSIADEIDKIETKLAKLKLTGGNESQINTLEQKLDELRVSYEQTMNALKTPLSSEQLSVLYAKAVKTKESIELLENAVTDLNTEAAKRIKGLLADTGKNGLEYQMQNLRAETEKYKTSSVELQNALKQLDAAMDDVNSADQSNDNKKLVDSYEKLKVVIGQVESQLGKLQDAEKASNKSGNFELDKQKALQRLKGLFSENSEAARKFGSEMQGLEIAIANCGDDSELRNINKQIDILSSNVKQANVQTQSLGERIKTQFQKYSTYFGVAELIMYTEQGLRDMFEQVKLIDSAMTELKKVTNETDATYSRFLSNAGDRAKAIGTTIDGLVQSTSQFARLGYGFEDAQGLAEVANIYAVVGDEVEGVEGATTSLISTMTAFKDEMKGLSNTDFSMGIIDVFNELGNKFAISSGGLGEAFQRAASSMSVAGNTLSETASLIVAANTVVQNPEKVGRHLPTIKVAI